MKKFRQQKFNIGFQPLNQIIYIYQKKRVPNT